MKPILEGWTIVMVGSWNPRIFQPEWVAPNLFPGEDVEAEFLLQAGVQGIRITSGPIVLLPSADRVVVGVKEDSEVAITAQEAVSLRILDLLSHTPIRAVGVNFRFEENDPPEDLLAVFDFSDRGTLVSLGDVSPDSDIRRTLTVEGNAFELRAKYSEGNVVLHFNFHRPVESAAEGIEAIAGRAQEYRNLVGKFLVDAYDLELDEGDETGDA